jgi:hypothetical protein
MIAGSAAVLATDDASAYAAIALLGEDTAGTVAVL